MVKCVQWLYFVLPQGIVLHILSCNPLIEGSRLDFPVWRWISTENFSLSKTYNRAFTPLENRSLASGKYTWKLLALKRVHMFL